MREITYFNFVSLEIIGFKHVVAFLESPRIWFILAWCFLCFLVLIWVFLTYAMVEWFSCLYGFINRCVYKYWVRRMANVSRISSSYSFWEFEEHWFLYIFVFSQINVLFINICALLNRICVLTNVSCVS